MTREDIKNMDREEVLEYLDSMDAAYPQTATDEGLRDQLERSLFIMEGL